MSAKPRVDPAGLPALIEHLEKLLGDPNALRSDAVYIKPWTDAAREARVWLDKTRQEAAHALRSGWVEKSLIEARFESAQQRLNGFLKARCSVLARLDGMHEMWAEAEPQAWAKWIRAEVARLNQPFNLLRTDKEYKSALSLVDSTFAGVERNVRLCLRRGRAPEKFRSGMTKQLHSIAEGYAAGVRAQLVAEVQTRLEAARVKLHKANTTSESKTRQGGRQFRRMAGKNDGRQVKAAAWIDMIADWIKRESGGKWSDGIPALHKALTDPKNGIGFNRGELQLWRYSKDDKLKNLIVEGSDTLRRPHSNHCQNCGRKLRVCSCAKADQFESLDMPG